MNRFNFVLFLVMLLVGAVAQAAPVTSTFTKAAADTYAWRAMATIP